MAYRLDESLGLTLTVFDGVVTGDEWRTVAREIFADPGWPPGRRALTDATTADMSAVTAADRAEIHAINGLHAHRLMGMDSAAVAGKNFEVARKFERADGSSGLRMMVFNELLIACAWLGLDLAEIRPLVSEVRSQARTTRSPGDALDQPMS